MPGFPWRGASAPGVNPGVTDALLSAIYRRGVWKGTNASRTKIRFFFCRDKLDVWRESVWKHAKACVTRRNRESWQLCNMDILILHQRCQNKKSNKVENTNTPAYLHLPRRYREDCESSGKDGACTQRTTPTSRDTQVSRANWWWREENTEGGGARGKQGVVSRKPPGFLKKKKNFIRKTIKALNSTQIQPKNNARYSQMTWNTFVMMTTLFYKQW